MTSEETFSLKHRSTTAALLGLALVAVAVLGTVQRWLPDMVSTVLGILGVAALIYGVATAIQVLLDSEPDE